MLFFTFAILIFSKQAGCISRILQHKYLVYLGNISYTTYMIHVIVINFFIKHNMGQYSLPTAIFCILVIYASSVLLYTFVEVPAKKVLKSFMQHKVPCGAAMKK